MFSSYPEQSTDPTTLANELAIYSKQGTNPAEADLFLRTESNGFVYQLTRVYSAYVGSFANNNNYGSPPSEVTQKGGWTFLPGGLLFQYGFYGKAGATPSLGVIQFPVPFTNIPFWIDFAQYNSASSNSNLVVDSGTPPTNTGFNYRMNSSSADGIYWSAIGI